MDVVYPVGILESEYGKPENCPVDKFGRWRKPPWWMIREGIPDEIIALLLADDSGYFYAMQSFMDKKGGKELDA